MSTRRETRLLPEAAWRDLPGQIRLSEQYHEGSKYRRSLMFRDGPRIVAGMELSPPDTFIRLPAPVSVPMNLDRALSLRKSHRRFKPWPLTQATLATLLGHAFGKGSYPSAGARYAVSVYVLIATGPDLEPGLYQYQPEHHGLIPEPCDINQFRLGLMPPGNPEELEAAPVFLCFVATFSQMQGKYGERGYRFCLQEFGHMSQNAQLVCTAMGLGSLVLGAYVDDVIHRAMRLDGTEQAVLGIMPVGLSTEEEQ